MLFNTSEACPRALGLFWGSRGKEMSAGYPGLDELPILNKGARQKKLAFQENILKKVFNVYPLQNVHKIF